MAATQSDIRNWLKRGMSENATHMIVVCDTFDWEDYPVFVKPAEDVKERIAYYKTSNMQKVMEVYNYSLDLESQLNEYRAWHE